MPITPVSALATRQYGVVSRGQLAELGLSPQQTETRIAAGHLIRVHRGVYAVGHTRLGYQGRWMAAVLACGKCARLSHQDALALYHLCRVPSGAVQVTAACVHHHPGIRCHRTRDLERLGDAVVEGIPVTSLERAVLDAGVTLSPSRLRGVLEEAERQGRFDRARLEAELEASAGHRGIGRLRAALDLVSDTPPVLRSGLEGGFLALLRGAGLPEPSVNVVVAGETFDFHWPREHVLAEIDSWRYHRSRRSFEDDRRRANVAALAGELLLRFTDARIATEPEAVVRELTAALAGRSDGGVVHPDRTRQA